MNLFLLLPGTSEKRNFYVIQCSFYASYWKKRNEIKSLIRFKELNNFLRIVQSLMNDNQKNSIMACKSATSQQRDFSKNMIDICEENLVYLRIWSIGNNLPSTDETKASHFQSHSIISQSLSQDYCVTCIVSKVWKWQRIQEEIASTLKQHLGCVPQKQPKNSLHFSYFYLCSNNKSQPQSIPLPALPECDTKKSPEGNTSTADLHESYMKIEGNCHLSPSIKLYPIFHRLDFWNAIHPYESIGSNVKWSVDMVVFCSPSEPLGRIQQYNSCDLNVQEISFHGSVPMKVEDAVGKRKHCMYTEGSLVINSPKRQNKGKKQRRRITGKSKCKLETESLAKQKDKFTQNERNNCKDQNVTEATNKIKGKVQDAKEKSNVMKCKKQSNKLFSTRQENSQHDKQQYDLAYTLASTHALSSLEDLPFGQSDSASIHNRDNNGLEIGQVPGTVCTQGKTFQLGTKNDEARSVIPIHNHKETDTIQSSISTVKEVEQKKKDGNARRFTSTSSHHNNECGANVKTMKERNKKAVTETSLFNPYDIICYPKRAALQNIGNRRLKILVEMAASHYNGAMDNAARSEVVNSVVAIIHEAGGKFFRWCQIRGYVIASPFLACLTAREKFDEALVFRGRPSQERSLYQILKVHDGAKR
jgi:hypothetical protein